MDTPEQALGVPITPAQPTPCAPGTKRDLLFAAMLLPLCILLADCLFWHGMNAGISVCAVLLSILGIVYLLKFKKHITAYGVFCAAAFLSGTVSLVFSDDGASKFLTLLLLVILALACLLELLQLRRHKAGSYGAIADGAHLLFVMSFGRLKPCFYALFHIEGRDGTVKKHCVGSVLLGVLCALPILGIVLPLLASSDAAFEGMLAKLCTDWMSELFVALLFGSIAFSLLFSLLMASKTETRPQVEKQEGRGLRAAPICAFLCAISVFYVLYLVSQLAYFFNAFGGILPENFSVAAYARRGFFEMSAVCVVNLILVALALIVSKKQDGKAALSVRLFSLFLCVFSLVLVATSLSKMVLYIQRFGMTRLRIATSVFMVFLTVVFLAVALRLFVRRVPYMKVAVIAAAVLLLGVSFANIDRIVAAYNISAYRNGILTRIDMDTLDDLSDAAVPYLLELTDDENVSVRAAARLNLTERLKQEFGSSGLYVNGEYFPDQSGWDLRDFNLVSWRARQLLLQYRTQYYVVTE